MRDLHQALCAKIEDANMRYHVLDYPAIADAEYDRLMRELIALEAEHPELKTPARPVCGSVVNPLAAFQPVTHETPMLSLDNLFSIEEAVAFGLRTYDQLDGRESLIFCCEPKIDGLAGEPALRQASWCGPLPEGMAPPARM